MVLSNNMDNLNENVAIINSINKILLLRFIL